MAHYTDGMTDEQKKMISDDIHEVRSGKHGAKMMAKGFDPFSTKMIDHGSTSDDPYDYLGVVHYKR